MLATGMSFPLQDELKDFRRLGMRHVLSQGLNFATVICTALMMWKALSVLTNTESPIVVVLRYALHLYPLAACCWCGRTDGLHAGPG